MNVDGAKLRRHTFVQVAIYKVIILHREGPLAMIVPLRQVEANYVTTILLKEASKVALCAEAARVFRLINDYIRLGC